MAVRGRSAVYSGQIKQRRLRWLGHVFRMPPERIPKVALRWTPPGKRKRGRPKITWRKTVEAELKKLKIEAMNPTGIGTILHSNSAPPFEYSSAPLCHCDWCMRNLGQNQGSLGINLSSTSACLRTTYSSTIDRLWTMESLWNEVLLYGYTKAVICINTFGIISSMS